MSTLRYTVCSYYPNLSHADKAYDFAVLMAGDKELALVGVNISAYQLKEENSFTQMVIEKTFEIMMRRVSEASKAPNSGFKILERVIAENQSNIQFRPLQDIQHAGPAVVAAIDVFEQEIHGRLPSDRISEDWAPRVLVYPERRRISNRKPQLV